MSKSRAHERFAVNFERSTTLLLLQKRLSGVTFNKEPKKISKPELDDLVRSAAVFGVAAMDTYFTARFAECLVPFLKKHGTTDALVDLLEKAGLDTRQSLEMIQMDRPYRRIRTLMDSYFDKYTTQRSEVIDNLFLAYGLKNLSAHAQNLTKRQTLLDSIDKIVQRRHLIVHEGDLNSHGKQSPISADFVGKKLSDIHRYVEACHQITAKRMGIS